ncbi:hypothetical protein A4H97_23645 [Niastella yeongjuensis]|uniref:Uncharacterized protein n=1 Tax=Niastella yeongjuensis TaxID=354355 RepID=A0A1V9F5A2_9BACT|nr:hypothetical protein [Niastella yeongjuensis]OQP53442.1 hypothetical protein A4H97_23645 [Niastella yeongjuensis]SEP12107.1 hypothetical protein SAMN05660816_04471 [Niastella yeongjuensis]
MNFEIMESFIKSIDDRLQQKLPVKTKDGERYFRDRFYWVVHKFKEQYFVGGKTLDTNAVLDQMFSFIYSSVGDLNLSKLHDFKVALACSLFATADIFGCSIKVPSDFFEDQFLRVIDQRFHRQSASVLDHAVYLTNVLVNAGVDHNKAIEIIEAGIMFAEICPRYNFSIPEFQLAVIGGILSECERLKIDIIYEQLSRYGTLL